MLRSGGQEEFCESRTVHWEDKLIVMIDNTVVRPPIALINIDKLYYLEK